MSLQGMYVYAIAMQTNSFPKASDRMSNKLTITYLTTLIMLEFMSLHYYGDCDENYLTHCTSNFLLIYIHKCVYVCCVQLSNSTL